MTSQTPFLYRDFLEARDRLEHALTQDEETYALLTGDTGTGKTALLRLLQKQLDRTRYRVIYFSQARKLGAGGLIKRLGEILRVRTSMCHAVTFGRLLSALADDTPRLMIWLDEAHELPEETLAEVRALAESDLDEKAGVQVLLCGLPRLRSDLQIRPHLWRRIVVREEITGLLSDEIGSFLDHHFPEGTKRLCEKGIAALFDRAKGAPGLVLPMYKAVLRGVTSTKGTIDVHHVEEALDRWDLA